MEKPIRLRNKGKYIVTCIAVVILCFVIKLLNDAGEFKSIVPHFEGECVSIPGVMGAEDITVLKNGIAVISCDDRRKTLAGTLVQGSIYAYNLQHTAPQLMDLTADVQFEFHPHGISVFENENGEIRLAAVNHTRSGHYIELFDLRNDALVHNRTISDSLLVSPNDLVLINESQMYVTNDHGSSTEWGKTLEEYLQLAHSNVVFYDGQEFTVAAADLAYANGINISRDGTVLYVAETIGEKIALFTRNIDTNELMFQQSIDMDSGIDNIELDSEGNLWIGSHPKLLTFTRHAKNAEKLSPSQVFKVSTVENDKYAVEEIYLDAGDELSGSSVASIYKNTLLIGSVFEDHFLLCSIAR